MHELGIMTGVVDNVRETALNAGAVKVLKIRLRIGVMTDVVEDSLQFAFEALSDFDELLSGCELEIIMVEPKSRCPECGLEYSHDRFHYSCPECGAFGVLLEGRELFIDSIEVDIPEKA